MHCALATHHSRFRSSPLSGGCGSVFVVTPITFLLPRSIVTTVALGGASTRPHKKPWRGLLVTSMSARQRWAQWRKASKLPCKQLDVSMFEYVGLPVDWCVVTLQQRVLFSQECEKFILSYISVWTSYHSQHTPPTHPPDLCVYSQVPLSG